VRAEPETYACLRSFCDQAYPKFQIVFGFAIRGSALEVVARCNVSFRGLICGWR